jgi:hypothetical protein
MITGQKPINSSKQGRFQIIDIVRMMEPLTKSSKQIVSGSMIKNNGFSQLTTPLPICVLKNGIQVLSTKFCIDFFLGSVLSF